MVLKVLILPIVVEEGVNRVLSGCPMTRLFRVQCTVVCNRSSGSFLSFVYQVTFKPMLIVSDSCLDSEINLSMAKAHEHRRALAA